MAITYDHEVAPKDDYFVHLAETAVGRLCEAVRVAFLVNSLPLPQYIPVWFRGAKWKRWALESRKLTLQRRDLPLAFEEAKIKEGKNALGSFFYVIVLFSDIQAISQKEIHRVIGLERLVNFDDRASLPYVEALYREAPRWRPVIALGLAHAASSDDLYKGYYIPKGVNILYNIWEITHNQERYPDQNTFKPSRFFNANGELNNNTVISAFGLGRRICLGRHVASDTVWLTIATVLQNLRIRKKQDANSEEIPSSITPRTTSANDLILEAVGRAA